MKLDSLRPGSTSNRHAGYREKVAVLDAQSPSAQITWNKMASFAIQSAKPATMVLALYAGNLVTAVKPTSELCVIKLIGSLGVAVIRRIPALPAPRVHMDADGDTPCNVKKTSTLMQDSAMMGARKVMLTAMVQSAGKNAPQARISVALSASNQENRVNNSSWKE